MIQFLRRDINGRHAQAHGFCVLHRDVAESANTDHGQPLAGPCTGALDATIGGDAGAKDWGHAIHIDMFGQVSAEGGWRHHVFGIAAWLAVARGFGARTYGFHALQAKFAGAAGPEHPRHANAIPLFEILYTFAQRFHITGDFMAGYKREYRIWRPIPFNRVQIAMANAAGLDLDQYFAGAGIRGVPRFQ